jgi:hypothetical protein
MPAKMARSATQPPFEVPGLRQSSPPPSGLVRKRKKSKIPRRFGVHLENPGLARLSQAAPELLGLVFGGLPSDDHDAEDIRSPLTTTG